MKFSLSFWITLCVYIYIWKNRDLKILTWEKDGAQLNIVFFCLHRSKAFCDPPCSRTVYKNSSISVFGKPKNVLYQTHRWSWCWLQVLALYSVRSWFKTVLRDLLQYIRIVPTLAPKTGTLVPFAKPIHYISLSPRVKRLYRAIT
jgi:hypothetical protein